MKQIETTINDLKSCSIHCVNHIHKILSKSTVLLSSQQKSRKLITTTTESKNSMKAFIKECKTLLLEQQNSFNQFEEVMVAFLEEEESKHSSIDEEHKNESSLFKSICPDWFLSIINHKSTSQKDDTVFSFQGVCATIEASSYIPNRLLAKDKHYLPSHNNSIPYYFRYSLQLTLTDRQNKFSLKSINEWEKDEKISHCQDKNCRQEFNWFQRKHHCRRCGHIYCNTHSGNRLPLFTAESLNTPIFSRVCDTCFFNLVREDSLTNL
ncbi:uncharacterized protein BX663DRAFT_502706 [Cokeromyces recurvatus]|uniref:uncharacterized protein n=1 Tax=Cokeromyces recurvatus TaxID=90255 RepID=UPI00221F821C|nr:uncharacterized protein BX663DRAFT_502706 [Cokeromyces recurvatus]KAI7904533.1 hypothetical protein BX663DRAFT_502706 [Cokeromyces recurvatus]